jgi:hypothetical protein
VPNHQEVFIAKDGFMSIIIDIFDRVDESDHQALTTHLEDVDEKLVEQDGTRQRTEFSKLPYVIYLSSFSFFLNPPSPFNPFTPLPLTLPFNDGETDFVVPKLTFYET